MHRKVHFVFAKIYQNRGTKGEKEMETQNKNRTAAGCPGAGGRRIFLQGRGVGHLIFVGDILYVEQQQRKLAFHVQGGEISINGRLRDYMDPLGSAFWPCHSYLAINLDAVEILCRGTVTFFGDQRIYLSRDAFGRTMKAMKSYRGISLENEGSAGQKTTK
jgi:DNA-binding LytR/AlgR family response regulator